MIKSLRIPIINAGNGIDEHPTQAMSDLYTIFKWRPHLVYKSIDDSEKITIGIIGVPSRMRTVRSLLKLFCKFPYFIKKLLSFTMTNQLIRTIYLMKASLNNLLNLI